MRAGCAHAVRLLHQEPDSVKQADPQPTGNLCERLRSQVKTSNWLKGAWNAAESTRGLNVPPSDSYLLVDSALADHRIQISQSILTVTTAQSAAFRKTDELNQRAYTKAVKVIDGGRPAAERILGTRAAVRRDVVSNGFLRCQWGSATRAVQVQAGDSSSDQAEWFLYLQNGGDQTAVHKVSVGTEGWQQTNGPVVSRTNRQTFVLVTAPGGKTGPTPILAFARAIAAVFGS